MNLILLFFLFFLWLVFFLVFRLGSCLQVHSSQKVGLTNPFNARLELSSGIWILVLLLFVCLPAVGFAQVNPLSDLPKDQEIQPFESPQDLKVHPPVVAPDIDPDIEGGAKEVPVDRVRVTGFEVTGNTLVGTEEILLLVSPYIGSEVDLPGLQLVAQLVTQLYRNKGFVLAKAYLPSQRVEGGVVKIAVLESKMGDLSFQGNDRYSDRYLRRHFSSFLAEPMEPLLERSLLILNDFPDLSVRAQVQEGVSPGTTDMGVTVEEHRRLKGMLEYNNFGSKFISRDRFGLTVDFAHWQGNLLSVRGIVGEPTKNMMYGRLLYSWPIGFNGTRAQVVYSRGDLEPAGSAAASGLKYKTEGIGLSLSYPWIKRRVHALTVEGGLDANNFQDNFFREDKIRRLSAGMRSDRLDGSGRNLLSFSLAYGLGELLGGMADKSSKSSRMGADDRFVKMSLDLGRIQRISDRISLMLSLNGQMTSRSLVSGEQFSIGGADSVRGYQTGALLGDMGYTLRSEMRVRPFRDSQSIYQKVHLALFVDHGAVFLKNPLAGEKKNNFISGYGAGIRWTPFSRFYLRTDVGYPLDSSDSELVVNEKGANVYVQALLQF